MSNKCLFKSKYSYFRDFILVQIILIFIVFVAFILSGNESLTNLYWQILYAVLIIGILQIFLVKRISATELNVSIGYPFIPFIKERKFDYCDIRKVYFGSNNSAYDPNVLKIFVEEKKYRKFYFFGGRDYQQLINLMRELGITVEVNSHIWK